MHLGFCKNICVMCGVYCVYYGDILCIIVCIMGMHSVYIIVCIMQYSVYYGDAWTLCSYKCLSRPPHTSYTHNTRSSEVHRRVNTGTVKSRPGTTVLGLLRRQRTYSSTTRSYCSDISTNPSTGSPRASIITPPECGHGGARVCINSPPCEWRGRQRLPGQPLSQRPLRARRTSMLLP